tara:strand:- start:63 stop:470 length:408 start_codon:yes stop_codon:yes gene_type:complete
MAQNITAIKGTPRAVGNRVLVTDMHFGEQTTKGGIIIKSDDGTTRGVYPRWAKVYSKGPQNKDDYAVGNWILVEHGRWTRGITIAGENGADFIVRMVETESILAYSDEKPEGISIGAEYESGPATHNPQDFVRAT